MTRRPALAACLLAAWLCAGCHDSQSAKTSTDPSPSGMGALEVGMNRQGRDLSDFGVRAADAAACARLCAGEPRCKAMSYMARTPPEDGVCWLKGSVPEPTPNPATVSAVKLGEP